MARDRTEYIQNYQREWMAQRRLRGIAFLGGKCVHCNSTEKLEIDHVIPASQLGYETPGGSLWSWSWSRIETELARCQLLCEQCHKAKTADERSGAEHGTASAYHNRKCRCDLCREWMRLSKRDYRARKQRDMVK